MSIKIIFSHTIIIIMKQLISPTTDLLFVKGLEEGLFVKVLESLIIFVWRYVLHGKDSPKTVTHHTLDATWLKLTQRVKVWFRLR